MSLTTPVSPRFLRRRGHGEHASALLGGLVSLLLAGRAVHAAPPPASGSATTPESSLVRAEELFFKGIAATHASDWAGALDSFEASRRLAPTWESTMNAAFCLEKLARYEEAVEMYEDLLASFSTQLEAAERVQIEKAIAGLQRKLARIEITTNLPAEVKIDGRPRGNSTGRGPLVLRVPAGTHAVRISKDGFDTVVRSIEFTAGTSVILDTALEASIPPPRPPPQPCYFIKAFAGYAISGSLGSSAETGPKVISHSPVSGFVGGLRGGYSFSSGVALEFSLGYLAVVSPFHRNLADPKFLDQTPFTLAYDLTDSLRLNGPFGGMGLSYRIPLTDRVDFLARATVGLLMAQSTDPITGKVCNSDQLCPHTVPVTISRKYQSLDSTSGLLMPEIGLDGRWGNFRVGASLGLVILTADGPSFPDRKAGVDPEDRSSGGPPQPCNATSAAGTVACAPNRSLVETDPKDPRTKRDLAYGSFVTLWVPQLAITYSF